jgi:hypothetical protein
MVANSLRDAILEVTDNFNQTEFESDNSYYFIRFSSEYVFLDLCSHGRIEPFSRLSFERNNSIVNIELMDDSIGKYSTYQQITIVQNKIKDSIREIMDLGLNKLKEAL